MTTKSAANSFGTFLETLQEGGGDERAASGDQLKLLTILLNSDARTVPELLKESGMGFEDFSEAFATTHRAGFITLVGMPGSEVVELTELGEEIARLEH